MRFRDHLRIIYQIIEQSLLWTVLTIILLLFGASGFVYDVFLSPGEQKLVAQFIRNMLDYWEWFIIAALFIICWSLYRRVLPHISIIYNPDSRYCVLNDGARMYRVDLVNYGEWQDKVSFRLEYIQNERGDYLPYNRAGLQREGGRGPMPLSPGSPKFGYLVQLDENDSESLIEVMTVSDLADGYEEEPIMLPREPHVVSVSLNPRIGRPCQRRYRVWIDNEQLKLAEIE